MALKIGARLRSQVDCTEVLVIQLGEGVEEVTCGGQPMVENAVPAESRLDAKPGELEGNQLGKRYTGGNTVVEVLVTRAGTGTLATAGVPLSLKEAKPLPASD